MRSFGHGRAPGKPIKFAIAALFKASSPLVTGIVQTGSILTFTGLGTANTGTVSTTITVPVDAEFVIVGWSGFSTTANFFAGGGMTFTKGGIDTAMTMVAGSDTSNWSGAMAYLALPDTGTNKTLKWDWLGTGTSSDPSTMCCISFWKGMDTASPVRGTGFGSAGVQPYTTGIITAASGDLFIAWCPFFSSIEDTINTWSGLSTLAQQTLSGNADAAWAIGSPSGNAAVAALTRTIGGDGSLFCISLKPATVSGINASLSVIEDNDTLTASTNSQIQSNLNIIEIADTLTSTVGLLIQSNLNAIEDSDTLSSTATTVANSINADLSITEASDTLASTVVLPTLANLSIVEASDSLGATTSITIQANLSIVETADSLSSNGALQVKSNLTISEGNDSLAGTASVGISSSLVVTEANDVLSASSKLLIQTDLSTVEVDDALSATTTTSGAISANLSIIEVNDILVAVTNVTIKSDASIVESNDSLVSTSKVTLFTILNVIENGDILVSNASTNTSSGIVADLNIIENNDILYSNVIKIPCFYMGGSSSASSKPKTKTKQELTRLINIERSKIRVTYHK